MGRLFGDGAAMDGRGVEAVVVEWIILSTQTFKCRGKVQRDKGKGCSNGNSPRSSITLP